jgi:hypothetical protein
MDLLALSLGKAGVRRLDGHRLRGAVFRHLHSAAIGYVLLVLIAVALALSATRLGAQR